MVQHDIKTLAQIAKLRLLTYTRFCDPKFIPGRFHKKLFREVCEPIIRGEKRRVILNVPPQHGKSRAMAQELPSYILGRDPTKKLVLGAYSRDLSDVSSTFVKDRLNSPEHRLMFPECQVRKGPIDHWFTTKGGYFKSVSTNSPLTGHGADGLIIDDPIKDAAEARSLTYRNAVWAWYLGSAMSRLSANAFIVIIMTRWHVDDLSGRLLNEDFNAALKAAGADSESFEHITMPAIAGKDDWLGRSPGEALFPERFSIENLRAKKAVYEQTQEGRHQWAALYDQTPTVRGGNYIAVENFQYIDAEKLPIMLRWVRGWDLAATDKESSDYTAGGKVALDTAGNLYIDDMQRGQWRWPRARTMIASTASADKIEIGVEAVSGFRTAYDNLLEVLPPTVVCRPLNVDGDKLQCALPWIGLVDRKKVFLVRHRDSRDSWHAPFIQECEAWNPEGGNTHDDQIDSISRGFKMLSEGAGMASKVGRPENEHRRGMAMI